MACTSTSYLSLELRYIGSAGAARQRHGHLDASRHYEYKRASSPLGIAIRVVRLAPPLRVQTHISFQAWSSSNHLQGLGNGYRSRGTAPSTAIFLTASFANGVSANQSLGILTCSRCIPSRECLRTGLSQGYGTCMYSKPKAITHALHLQMYTKSPHFKTLNPQAVARVLEGIHKTTRRTVTGLDELRQVRASSAPSLSNGTNAAGFDFRERIFQCLFRAAGKPTYAVWINLQQCQGQGCCSWLFESGQRDTMNAVPSSPSEALQSPARLHQPGTAKLLPSPETRQ
ncbi:uncharacterized protein TRIVIDRAFT_60785 [Trichoderma virens Gv29-8]|uniref:Uncharacterized protein n=1 Tax=Hypocrea virens (strain Gv29-8 / FGSC 10586) TaxID=413071 RepID=G9MTK0_HYPVG|nr:uncharacterized protein TRIVIDRAFT_60785 [Trichoderma virens Gv29-8]EHK22351.1 hypothetical protein TRIVIDRAFT_60785 [Trichoderma virens Gv29-8]UKZ47390.1 hypothetical protein TrVGV298_001608 [Trichoderma virens]